MQASHPPIRAVLFDLGGVVIDVDFERALASWARHSRLPLELVRERFRTDGPYHRHETGHLGAEAFFAHLRQMLDLQCDERAVQEGFNACLVAEIAQAVELLDAIRPDVPRYAISNTNAVHVAEIERAFPTLLPRFTRVFASHEIGHRKPDAAAFQHVLDAIGVPAPQALLFDDLQPNIDAAQALGMQVVLVRGPEDIRQGLQERGLLGDS